MPSARVIGGYDGGMVQLGFPACVAYVDEELEVWVSLAGLKQLVN